MLWTAARNRLTALVFAALGAIFCPLASAEPIRISMADLPNRDLAPRLTLVSQFNAPCAGPLRFGTRGETILLDCDAASWLGMHHRNPGNLNLVGPSELRSEQTTSGHVYRTSDGALLRSISHSNLSELIPLVALAADGAWLAGTERSDLAAGPRIFLLGSSAMRAPLPAVRSQMIGAHRLDERRVAIVYEAWTDPSVRGRFPEPFVAVVDFIDNILLSDSKLQIETAAQTYPNGVAFDAEGVSLFYRRFRRPPQQSDWYGGGASGEVALQRFGFDGTPRSEVGGFGFDAGYAMHVGETHFFPNSSPPDCGESIVAVVRQVVRQCYQRSRHPQTSNQPGLRRQRPTEAEQFGYQPYVMDDGRFIAIVGQPGVDERSRNPSARSPTHVFDTRDGRYLGVLPNGATVARDAPLLATKDNGRVSIWRLEQ